ncbi:MAG: trehalose-6-phosphate synthase [Rhodothermales bacterium]|nr:trehalose-6-phosphate synthase [Rhodothermales bacterium]
MQNVVPPSTMHPNGHPEAAAAASRLIVVANRAPMRKTDAGWEASVGGLATAVLPVLETHGGVWVSMREDADLPERHEHTHGQTPFAVRRVPLSDGEFDAYYYGMANRVLWPVSHYMIEHLTPRPDYMDAYRAVNRRFAEAVVEEYQPGDAVWIHDYHLMLAPHHVRRALPDASIALFWHIPWPSVEVFRVLPWAGELLHGLLGCDLIGFHVAEYVANFLECVEVLLGAEVEDGVVHWQGRRIRVEAHPIGIDVARFEQMSAREETQRQAEALRREVASDFLVVGVDRLDYTKGILARLLAFEQFLKRHPEYHGRITFYQIATPSRTEVDSYQQLKRDVDEAVGRINGAFARDAWVPVRYRYRTYTQEELCAFYRAADVALITPLRDGMNLVTQEFIASTERGVLVLSELTGAGFLLPEALLVNPYDRDAVADALLEALTMDEHEKRECLHRLKQRTARLDVHRWADGFLTAMAAPA